MKQEGNSKQHSPNILEIVDWDGEFPSGNWIGPEPLALFPFELTSNRDEQVLEFRDSYIQYYPNSEQHGKIVAWINQNIPENLKWLLRGFDFLHPQMQSLFYALNSVHISKKDQKLKKSNPEVLEDDWDAQLDAHRNNFLSFLKKIGCQYRLVREYEAIDNGMLILKDNERPNILASHDSYPGEGIPPKKLWRYFTLTKFLDLLQNKSIWFSRPQYFDDPHEFTMDISSQRQLLQWKLDSFAREYNRAVESNRKLYIAKVEPLIEGLPLEDDGKIKKSSIKLTNISKILLSSIRNDIRKWQESFYISCWRYSTHDSVAIWNQYATLEEGIAIVVDLDELRKSFQKFGDVRLAIVEYRDLSNTMNVPMQMNPLTYKDIRFNSEEEARFYFRAEAGKLKGINVPIDLATVIKEIHLSPNSSILFKGIIQNLLHTYEIKVPLIESSLSNIPSKF